MMPELEYTLNASVDLIIANKPTLNNRTYSLECLNRMRVQIQEQINNKQALIYDSFDPSNIQANTPDISKVVGIIEGVKLTDRLSLDIRSLRNYFDETMLANSEVLPVIYGEITVENDMKMVKNPHFLYFTLSPKLERN